MYQQVGMAGLQGLDLLEHALGVDQVAELRLGQVDLAHNPCNHGLGAKPMRVRNIFTCSGVVFPWKRKPFARP